jgi:hypothetical protein
VCVPTNVSNATTAPKVPGIVRARVSARTCGPFIVVPDADHALLRMISQFGLARSSALYQLQVGSDAMGHSLFLEHVAKMSAVQHAMCRLRFLSKSARIIQGATPGQRVLLQMPA